MQALIEVILPVFLVIGFGYVAVWRRLFDDSAVAGLMRFTQNFAIPCLLFRAISTLDLGQEFAPNLLASFYAGAAAGFVAGLVGGRFLFHRSWEDAVAFGFCGMFSNSALLGLPIAERAFGTDALRYNYAIIAIHSPVCYGVGVTVMEMVRNRGGRLRDTARRIVGSMLHNALVIGIGLGFVVNLSGLDMPGIVTDAIDLMVRAAIPAALFGLGGVLYRYRPEGDLRAILWVCLCSLIVHPMVTYGLGRAFGLGVDPMRAAVITAAMAPGVNTYIFANLYGTARRVAASGVLVGTGASILSVWLWLTILP
ncbi:AEC family transporter [Mesobaculum littorinae]|uniref:AEC family transporter n=1 Tax=Mesobaculum littorinae TaxID=2486419 RepID=A0A438AEV3_9RHOB|nr:AEC family transporter [Mesobaculum littorinae]RVV97230.1 AEC family transporter [Mesobaculum littorinae]